MVTSIEDIKEFLSTPDTIAVVGASTKPNRAGHYVPKFLQELGFKIIPINPFEDHILGNETIDDLDQLETDVAGIIIYRNNEAAEKVAFKAIEMRIPMIWLPDNITSELAKAKAEDNGLNFVQDRCPLRDSKKLL